MFPYRSVCAFVLVTICTGETAVWSCSWDWRCGRLRWAVVELRSTGCPEGWCELGDQERKYQWDRGGGPHDERLHRSKDPNTEWEANFSCPHPCLKVSAVASWFEEKILGSGQLPFKMLLVEASNIKLTIAENWDHENKINLCECIADPHIGAVSQYTQTGRKQFYIDSLCKSSSEIKATVIFHFLQKIHFLQLSHTTARVEDPQAKQPSSASCGVRLLWIMAEGARRCSSSRSTDKLSQLDASVPTVPSFPQSHQQHGSGAAHRASSQQSFDNSLPPGRQPIQALMVSQCCLLELFPPTSFLYSSSFSSHLFFSQWECLVLLPCL